MNVKKIPRKIAGLMYRMVIVFFDPIRFIRAFFGYGWFIRDYLKYKKMLGSNSGDISLIDWHPILDNQTKTTSFDPAYFYQGVWAFKKILDSSVAQHVDVASQTNLVSFLTTIVRVTFVDIRPLEADLDNYEGIKGSVTDLPFQDDSIQSLSCLHVIEHVGLGRYGDPLDVSGTIKSCSELQRVLMPGGNLLVSLPIGETRICFNAHRVHDPLLVMELFGELELVEFSCIDDLGKFHKNADPSHFQKSIYSTGLYHFKKKE
jgi:SAM-dependent methyltransferase